ncbi:hypothetical protein PHLCEN_2v7481 [Hermanssonia centrifuga]|uniref:Uncharacterized protein n=1 Tax=Hermanssonia centrifuga TaxID=98765 RepID=A0A2R6NWI3_9APHY|nr:hypothetical protein PHLCEN_2v7481 [Hermanssonia centrifuga]
MAENRIHRLGVPGDEDEVIQVEWDSSSDTFPSATDVHREIERTGIGIQCSKREPGARVCILAQPIKTTRK